MPRPVDAVLVGAGMRGYNSHGRYAREHPDTLRFVAVAEPDAAKRERFARAHNLPPERCFASWEELVAHEQLAPVLINATNDGVHFASTMGALEAGYDVLLEKPIASTLAECVTLVQTAAKLRRSVWVTHTLRHSPFFPDNPGVGPIGPARRRGGSAAFRERLVVSHGPLVRPRFLLQQQGRRAQ